MEEEEEKEMKGNVLALRELYVLLQQTCGDMDERTRFLFKNLLDTARDNTLHIHSEIIAAPQQGINVAFNSMKPAAVSNLKPYVSSMSSTTETHSSFPVFEQYGRIISSKSNSQDQKKRCRICQQIPSAVKATACPLIQSKAGEAATSEYSHTGQTTRSWILGKEERIPRMTGNKKVLQAADLSRPGQSQSKKFTAERSKQVTGAASCRDESSTYHYVHGLRIPPTQDDGLINHPIHIVSRQKQHNQTIQDAISVHDSAKQQLMKPMLLYESPSQSKSYRQTNKKGGVTTKKSNLGPQNQMTFPYHEQGTNQVPMSSFSSSYSLTSWPEAERQTSISSLSEMSRQFQNVTPESSRSDSGSSNFSSLSSGSRVNADVGPARKARRHRNLMKSSPEKRIGRLRRLKDKLKLIFHHHHHHHHHLHHHHHQTLTNKDDNRSNRKERAYTTSIWKNLPKILHRKDKRKDYEKQAVAKMETSAVGINQVGHFQAVVKGLMRHVGRSKKSKPPKGRTRRADHKQRWWELFQRKHGVKMTNKGRVKLQLASKKPQIKPPKKLI